MAQGKMAGMIVNDGRALLTLGEGGMDFSGHIIWEVINSPLRMSKAEPAAKLTGGNGH